MAKNSPVINDVSDTALWVAVFRADESKRHDALFQDPLAGLLAGERGREIAAKMSMSRYTSWSIVIRTCIIDAYVRKLAAEGVDTVLNLGAGLDTRPYRLALPKSLRWIEVDYPHIIEKKENLLAKNEPLFPLERVKLDLADLGSRKAFFKKVNSESKKVLILTEGVTPYLTNDQVAHLAEDLHDEPHFRYWIVDYNSPVVVKHLQSAKRRREMGSAQFQFAPEDWEGFFAQNGWQIAERRYSAKESFKLGRSIPVPWWYAVIRRFIPRKNPDDSMKFSGYFLMEPKGRVTTES
jgi:methyltransferase (TIGR00027 family)